MSDLLDIKNGLDMMVVVKTNSDKNVLFQDILIVVKDRIVLVNIPTIALPADYIQKHSYLRDHLEMERYSIVLASPKIFFSV